MTKTKPSFWVTNISKMNVSVADLSLTIKSLTSVNLLDSRHYYYTLDQLLASANSGSLYKKRDKLFVRKVPPQIIKMDVPMVQETYIPSRERSVFNLKQETYEELNISDEQFAAESLNDLEMDNQFSKNRK